jgi:hypothetical protein
MVGSLAVELEYNIDRRFETGTVPLLPLFVSLVGLLVGGFNI